MDPMEISNFFFLHPSLVLPWCESLEAREWLPERVETVEGDESMIRGFEERLEDSASTMGTHGSFIFRGYNL